MKYYAKLITIDYYFDADEHIEVRELEFSNPTDYNEWFWGYYYNECCNECKVINGGLYLDEDCTTPVNTTTDVKPIKTRIDIDYFEELPF